jgi:hypothetical protein
MSKLIDYSQQQYDQLLYGAEFEPPLFCWNTVNESGLTRLHHAKNLPNYWNNAYDHIRCHTQARSYHSSQYTPGVQVLIMTLKYQTSQRDFIDSY